MKLTSIAFQAASIGSLSVGLCRGQAVQPAIRPEEGTKNTPVAREVSDAERAQQVVASRAKRIQAELASLNRADLNDGDWAKEWAGTYYTGGGLGMNVTIQIAPKSGLTYTWYGCMGLYDAAHGDIVEADAEGVRIKFAPLPRLASMNYMSSKLYFVRWGERKYLVPEQQMCKVITSFEEGGYSRREMYSIPEMRDVSARRDIFRPEPEGLPKLPGAYADQLKYEDIRPSLARVEEPAAQPEHAGCYGIKVEIDKGSADAVRLDSLFSYRQGKSYGLIRVDNLRTNSCTGTLLYFLNGEPETNMPLAGKTFSFWVKAKPSANVLDPAPPQPEQTPR